MNGYMGLVGWLVDGRLKMLRHRHLCTQALQRAEKQERREVFVLSDTTMYNVSAYYIGIFTTCLPPYTFGVKFVSMMTLLSWLTSRHVMYY